MKTLIIIALIYFIFKKKKPHVTAIQFVAKATQRLVKGVTGVWKRTQAFWATMFMEFECARKPDEQKQIREDFALFMKHIDAKRKDLDDETVQAVTMVSIRRYWGCSYYPGDYHDCVAVLSLISLVIALAVTITLLAI